MEGAYVTSIDLSPLFPERSVTLDPGTYELKVEVEYTARSVTSKRTGAIMIYVMWPG